MTWRPANLSGKPKNWHTPLLFGSFFLALVVILGWSLLFGNEVLCGPDIINQFLPYKQLVREALANGEFPHWTPMTFGGRPLQADIQIGLFYPPNILFLILPMFRALTIVTLLHFWIGAMGMALWTSRRLRHPAAACLAGTLYMFSACAVTYINEGIFLFPMAMAWLPCLLWAWDRVQESLRERQERLPWDFALLTIIIVLEFLAGAPQYAFYSLGILGFYAIVLAWGAKDEADFDEFDPDGIDDEQDNVPSPFPAIRFRALWPLAAAVLLAVGIAAVQILPTKMLIDQSWNRAEGASWEYTTADSLPPRLLWTLISPTMFGNPLEEGNYWGGMTGYHEVALYMSALPLFLLLVQLIGHRRFLSALNASQRRQQRRIAIFLWATALLSLLLSFGKFCPAFWLAYHLIPGFDRFRVPARLIIALLLAVSALTAWAFDRIADQNDNHAPATHPFISPIAITFGAGVTGLLLLYFFTPRLLGYLEMPGYAFLSMEGAPQGEMAQKFLSMARSGVLSFLNQWVLTGLLIAAIIWFRNKRILRETLVWATPILCAGCLLYYGIDFIRTAPADLVDEINYPKTERVAYLQKALKPGERYLWFDSLLAWSNDQNQPELTTNRPIHFGLAQLRGYHPIVSRRYGLFLNQMTGQPPLLNPRAFMMVQDYEPNLINWKMLALWNCPIVMSYEELKSPALTQEAIWTFPPAPEFPGGPSTTLRAYRLNSTLGPAWLCQPLLLPADISLQQIARILGHEKFDPTAQAIVQEDLIPFILSKDWEPGKPAAQPEVNLIRQTANTMTFDIATTGTALLTVAQNYYPGWHATVDGKPMPVISANLAQCAIPVPPGRHQIMLRYRPREFTQGAAITLSSLLLFLFIIIRWVKKERDMY